MQQNEVFIIQRNTGNVVAGYQLQDRIKIGRSRQGGGITIPSPLVSRTHGEFFIRDGSMIYQDLNSSNGTYINGLHYGFGGEEKEKQLEDGDVLRIDTTDVEDVHEKAVLMIYRNTAKKVLQWQALELAEAPAVIRVGRSGQNADICITDQRISRDHAAFFYAQNGWAVEDHGSVNGVFINNKRVTQAVSLKVMDCVRILDYLFLYLGDTLLIGVTDDMKQNLKQNGSGRTQRDGAGKELKIQIKKRTVRHGFRNITLLKDIHMTIRSGEFVLVLGGSGAGKTTFMNAVMGYEKAEGMICYGGTDIYSQYNQMKYEIGFVPQDTLLRENDSVYDTLYNAAQMKMPSECSSEQLKCRVDETLAMVNLTHVSRSLIRSVSGGEKKRVSVGVELISDPGLFFLDEPDSGLDAQSAVELMENLRAIADTGKIVMIISHSPDRAAAFFDKVIVLAKSAEDHSGHLAFFGDVKRALAFFETDSLEGIVGRINGRDGMGGKYIERWKVLNHDSR